MDLRARRGRPAVANDAQDLVHAAMGELEARALQRPGRTIAIGEPYQHYQFAGRADLLAWDAEDLLHIENRTRFPNLQEPRARTTRSAGTSRRQSRTERGSARAAGGA
ncbi:MAG TPA: hypothetical protein VFY23_14425 [Candidatus Limnocylindrales bacterium]|nr:hypothetical protein [Candidatus Limnocylindrales bacterium]